MKMKINLILISCVLGALVLLSACAPKTPALEEMSEEMKILVETAARQVVMDLAAGSYAAVVEHFDGTMADVLPEDKLKEGWESTVAQAGSFAEITAVESFMQDGYYVCLVTTRHEFQGIVTRVVYDKDMRIAGMYNTLTDNETELAEGEEAVTIGTEFPLEGILAMPDGEGQVPAVVLVHGSGPSDKDESAYGIKVFKDISDYLAADGIAVLRYDKRTYAHADKLSNEGMTVKEETIEDAILAGQLLAQDGRIDSARIFVIGHSLGGMLAPRIVEESGTLFAGAVIMAGSPRSLTEIVYDQNMYFIALADESERDALTKQLEDAKPYYGLPQGYIDEMDAYPAFIYLDTTDKPFLIMQGSKDFQVSVEKDFKEYKRLGIDRNSEYRLYDNLTHFFTVSSMETPTTDDYVAGAHVDSKPLEDIAKWIKER
jgi:dienelactone hydrolase